MAARLTAHNIKYKPQKSTISQACLIASLSTSTLRMASKRGACNFNDRTLNPVTPNENVELKRLNKGIN